MAFNLRNLSPTGGQSRSGVNSAFWVFNNVEADTVTAAGFFNEVATKLKVRDIIDVVDEAAGVPTAITRYGVTASDIATGVTIVAL